MPIIPAVCGCLFISIIWNILFWDRSYGISMPIFVIIVISFLLWLKRNNLSKSKLTVFIHSLLLVYLSLCVVYYRNSLVIYATVPSIFAGLGALIFIGQECYSFSNFLGVIEYLVKKSLGGFASATDALGSVLSKVDESLRTPVKVVFLKIFLGIIISIPFLIVFVWLFTSADPVFKIHLQDFFDFIWQPDFFKRGVVIIFMWFLFCGYLKHTEGEFSLQSHLDKIIPKQNYDGTIIFVFLLMNNLLFLSFIIVQLEYLFGGEAIIRNTPFTYAEYVHRGFYEFWITVILISMIILVTNYRLKEQEGRIRRIVECNWVAMICQTLIIIASGVKRISAYEEAYGYTYLRILVALFLLWVAGSLVIFIMKIIWRKSIVWLISYAICLAFVFLIFVSTFSIDEFIARKNIDRYLKEGKELDMGYLSYLSTDAFQEIERLKMQAKDEHIRNIAEDILFQYQRTANENLQHWASWNFSLSKFAR